MDIMSIIDKYVEISMKRKKVEDAMSCIEHGVEHSQIKANDAFNGHDYELENTYIKANSYYKQMRKKYENEMCQVMQDLENIHQQYLQKINSMNNTEIEQASKECYLKISLNNKRIDELSEKSSIYEQKGREAFKNHDFELEQKYNTISTESYREMENIKASMHYYNAFISELSFRLESNDRSIELSGFSK